MTQVEDDLFLVGRLVDEDTGAADLGIESAGRIRLVAVYPDRYSSRVF